MASFSDRIRAMLQANDSPLFLRLPACINTALVPVGDLIYFTSEHGRSIFQQVAKDSQLQDNKRLQVIGADVPDTLRQTYSHVNNFVIALTHDVDPTLRVSPESIIVSMPGCIPQSFHGDYDYENPASRRSYFILVGLMTSRLHYLEFHDGFSIAKILTYKAGDLVICRGDLIHAGAGYSTANVRLRYYIDLPRTRREAPARKLNKTYLFSDDAGYYEFSYYSITRNFHNMCKQVQLKRRYHGELCARMRAAKKARASTVVSPPSEDTPAEDSP